MPCARTVVPNTSLTIHLCRLCSPMIEPCFEKHRPQQRTATGMYGWAVYVWGCCLGSLHDTNQLVCLAISMALDSVNKAAEIATYTGMPSSSYLQLEQAPLSGALLSTCVTPAGCPSRTAPGSNRQQSPCKQHVSKTLRTTAPETFVYAASACGSAPAQLQTTQPGSSSCLTSDLQVLGTVGGQRAAGA